MVLGGFCWGDPLRSPSLPRRFAPVCHEMGDFWANIGANTVDIGVDGANIMAKGRPQGIAPTCVDMNGGVCRFVGKIGKIP